MKKTIAYMTTAILLGAITILLPLKLIPSLPSPSSSFVGGEDSNYLPSPCLTESQGAKAIEGVERLLGYRGPEAESTATFPSSLFHIGVLLSFGLIFAAGVSLFLKRRLF